MHPLNRINKPRNGAPTAADASSKTDKPEPTQLSDVRNALQQTMDVFGSGAAEGAGPATGLDDLFSDAAPVHGGRPTYASRNAQRGDGPPTVGFTRLQWALGAAVLTLIASVALFFIATGSYDERANEQTVLVLRGDSLMAAGEYEAALARYTAAQKIQPNDPYIRQRLAQLARLQGAASQMALDPDEQHRRLLAQGDSLLGLLRTVGSAEPLLAAQINAAAREAYLRALVYHPDDRDVRDKLTLLAQRDSLLAKQTGSAAASAVEAERMKLRQQQLEQYRRAIQEGDRYMAGGDYLEAQIRFKEALIYQKDDTYAAQRLEMIDALWKEANRTERFEGYRRRGDELLEAKFYDQARMAYREALAIMPDDAEILARIEECDRLEQEAQQQLAQEHARELQYRKTLAAGDALVAAGQHEAAFQHFLAALETYPNDPDLEQRAKRVQDELYQQIQVNEDGIYQYLTDGENPKLIGTLKDLYAKINYPESAIRDRLEGRVFVEFVVDEEGRVQDPRVLRGLSADCDREVLRVIRTARFEPGRVDGQPVKVRQTLHITFKLTDDMR